MIRDPDMQDRLSLGEVVKEGQAWFRSRGKITGCPPPGN